MVVASKEAQVRILATSQPSWASQGCTPPCRAVQRASQRWCLAGLQSMGRNGARKVAFQAGPQLSKGMELPIRKAPRGQWAEHGRERRKEGGLPARQEASATPE